MRIALAGLIVALTGCDEPLPPEDPDTGVRDGGTEGGGGPDVPVSPPDDAGIDASEPDTGTSDLDGGPADAPPDTGIGVDAGRCQGPPGLYAAGSCENLSPGIQRFAPQYVLWSDGADKDRFVLLPPGTRIDTTDPNRWIYPPGTKFWKTFTRNGLRVETRYLEKVGAAVGPSAWSIRTFAWNMAQNGVQEITTGLQDALGTQHDIPTIAQCIECHNRGTADVILGFSAIQLNHAGTAVTLEMLNTANRLSAAIPVADAVVPGNMVERTALGYLHANCGGCHGGPLAQAGMRLWVNVGLDTVGATDTYSTAIGVPALWTPGMGSVARVAPGDPTQSAIALRMMLRTPTNQMPPIATEIVDMDGVATITAWIESLR